jgi:hypothetical protein
MSLLVCPNKNTKAWKHLENLVGEDRALALYIANNEKTPYTKFDVGLRAISYSWDQILNIKKNLRKYNHRFNSSHMLTQPQPIGQSTLYTIDLIEDWGSKVVPKSSNSYEYDPSDREDKKPDWVKELEALQAPMIVTKSGNQYISLTGNVYPTYAEAIEDRQSNLEDDEAFIKFGEKYYSLLSYAKEYRNDILDRYGIQKLKGIYYYHLSALQTDRISKYEKGKSGKYEGKPVGTAKKGFTLLDNLEGELNYRIENGKGYIYIDVKEFVTRDGVSLPETVHYLKLPVTLVANDDLEIFKRSVAENEAYEALFDKEIKKYLFKTKRATPFQAANFTLLQLEQLVVAALANIGNPMTLSQFRQLPADEKLKVIESLGMESIIDRAVDTYEKALQSIKPEELKQEITEVFQNHFQGQEKTDFKNILDVLPADFLKLITFEHILSENAYFRRASAKNKIDIPSELVALQQVYDMRVAYAMNVALRSMMDDGLVTEEEVKELNRKILPAVKAKVKGSLTEKIGKYKAIITTLKHGDKFRSYWDAAVADIENIVSDKNKGLSELIVLYSSKLGGLSTVFTEVALGDIDPARLKFKYDRNTVAVHELGHAIDFYLTSTKPNDRIKILAFINDLVGRQEFQDYLEKGLKSRGYSEKNTEEITADLFAWIVGKAAGYDVRSGHLESLDDFFAKNWELANDIYSLHFDLDVKEGIASTIVDWMRIQLNKLIDAINSKLNFPLFKPFTDSSTGIEVFPEYNNYHVANLFQDIRDMILDSDMYDIRKILTSQTQKDFTKLRISEKQGVANNLPIKPGVQELFESNPELANAVYEAAGFKPVIKYHELKLENIVEDKEGKVFRESDWEELIYTDKYKTVVAGKEYLFHIKRIYGKDLNSGEKYITGRIDFDAEGGEFIQNIGIKNINNTNKLIKEIFKYLYLKEPLITEIIVDASKNLFKQDKLSNMVKSIRKELKNLSNVDVENFTFYANEGNKLDIDKIEINYDKVTVTFFDGASNTLTLNEFLNISSSFSILKDRDNIKMLAHLISEISGTKKQKQRLLLYERQLKSIGFDVINKYESRIVVKPSESLLSEFSLKEITPQQKQQALQLYSQYLDTIFPDSKVKDILYHASPVAGIEEVIASRFGIYLSYSPVRTGAFGYNIYAVIINAKNLLSRPKREEASRKELEEYNNALNDFYSSYSDPQKPPVYQYDSAIESSTTTNEGIQIKVRTSEQARILGSKQDIEGFKEFITSDTLALPEVGKQTVEVQQKFAKARSAFELHPSIPSKNAREIITTLRGMMVEAIAAQTLNAAKIGKKNFKPTAMKSGVLIVLPYLHKEYQKLLNIPEEERTAEQNFTIAQWEILSGTDVLPKLQKFVILELKQLGYKFDSEGLAEAPKEDESTLSSTIEQDETINPDKSILDVLVEGEDENQVGKGSQGNDYAGMSRSTKSTLSTIVKGWLSGIPTTTPSIIGFGKNTYKDLNEVVAVLNSLLRDKATGDEQIAALKKAATQSKEREWLNIIADRLKNEKAIDSPIYNQFVTKFYQKFNQLRLVRTYFEPKGYEATENGVKRFFPLKDKAGNLIYSLTVKVINLNREDVPKNLRDAWANNFLMGSFSIESEGRFQGMTTVNPEMREAIKEAYNNFKTFASINYNPDRGWTSPNMAKEKLNNLFQLIGVDLNALTLEDLLNGFNLDGDKQTFVPYTSKVKGSAFSPKSGFMAQIFDPILEGTETTNNPFGSSGMIRVSEIMSQYIDDYVNTSVSDGKGRKLWAYGIADPNWVEHSKIIASATEKTPDGKSLTDAEYEKTYIGQILKDKYSGRSRILNKLRDLRNKPKDLKAFSEALQIFSFNTLKGEGATEGKELKNMVEAEHIFTKIALFTDVKKAIANSKIIQMFITTPSDKSRMECITTLKLNKAFKIDPKTGTISIQEGGTKTLFNYFLAEYDRIREFQAASPEARATFMSNENYLPEVFYHFPQFNDRNYIWKALNGKFVLRDLDEKLPNGMTVEDYIKSKLNSLALSAIESSRKMWEDSGIIQEGKLITNVPQAYIDEEVDPSLTKKDTLKIVYDQLKLNPESAALKEQASALETEVQRNATNYLIADYALNYLVHNMEMHMFLLGDPAMYVKDTKARNNALKEIERDYLTEEELKNANVDTIINFVRDVITHLGKRMAGVQGSRQAAADSKGRVTRVLKIADKLLINGKRTNFISKELADKVYEDLLGKDFVDKFKDIQPGDGQGLMSAKEDLYLKYRYGKIDKDTYTTILKKVIDASQDINNGLPIRDSAQFTDKEKFYTQPIKPLIFANKLDTVPSGDQLIFKRKVIYTKNSEFALYPQWTQGLEIDKFRVLMEKTNTDRIAFLSAIKTGADNVIDGVFLQDEDGTILINDEVVENFENFVAEDVDREYFGIQLEIPYDESKNKIRIGTQQIKALFDEVLDETFNFNGKKVKGSFLQTLQAKIYGRMVRNKLNSLFTEMGVTPLYKGLPIEPEDLKNVSIDQINFSFSNLELLSKTLIEHAEAQGYSTNILEGLKLTEDKQSFVVPLLFNGNLAKFEKLLLSMIKNVIFQKISGKSFVLGTELGILPKKRKTRIVEGEEGAEEIRKYAGGIVFVKGQDGKGFGERGLLGPRLKDKNNPNGEWLPGQVIIPWKFKAPLEQFIIDTPEGKFLDTSRMDEDLLKLIGIRIPTQGHPSMASIEIVGFLPKWAGDLMIAPQDFVAQFGYDFDVDKMYNYIYNYIYGNAEDKAELKKLKKQTREMFLKEMENVEDIPVEFKQALAYIKAADAYDDARYQRAEFRDFIEKNIGVRASKLPEMMEYFDTLSLEDINKINQAAYTEKGRLLHIKQATARGKTLKDHKKLADFISKENLGKTIAIKKAMTEYNASANDAVEQLYPEYDKYEEYLSTYKETREMSKERKAIQEKINSIVKAQRISKVEPNKDDLDDNDQAQLENYLMDIHHAVLSNPTVIKKSLEGIGEGKIKDLASTIKGFFQKDSNATYLPFSDKEKVLEFFDNAAGKIGTGIFSVAITFSALIQGKDVYLQTIDESLAPVPKPFRIKNNDGTAVDLYKLSAYSGVNRLISIFQSASLDNAKYKALYAISQNEETMGVTAILGALYNPEATEFDEEYITYFLMQPAIQEYIEILKSSKNSLLTDRLTRAEAQASYLEIFNKYEKKLTEVYKKQGFKQEDIQEQVSAALLNPGYSLNTITDDQGVEFPGIKDFFENQERMANDEEFLKAQLALLNEFVFLKNAADELRSIQYVINSDSKGTAPSLFESHYKEKRFRELFGEREIKYFSEGIYGLLYNDDTPSIPFLMSQVAFMANRIFNGNDRQDPILPFLTGKVGKLFDTMMEITGRTGDQTFNQRVVKEMFNSYLSYIWTNPNFKIADSSMQQERFNLLVDSENTRSLGTQLQEFKKTELYFNNPRLHPLISSLQVVPHKEYSDLKFVFFNASAGLAVDDEDIRVAIDILHDEAYPLFESLMKYQLLMQGYQSATNMRGLIPVYYFEGFDFLPEMQRLNRNLNGNYDREDLVGAFKELQTSTIIPKFIEQHLQHYPERAARMNEEYATPYTTPIFDKQGRKTGVKKDTSQYIIDFKALGDGNTNYYKVKDDKNDYVFPYLQMYDTDKKMYRLYRLAEKVEKGYLFKEMPILGVNGVDEFDMGSNNEDVLVSMFPENNSKLNVAKLGYKLLPMDSSNQQLVKAGIKVLTTRNSKNFEGLWKMSDGLKVQLLMVGQIEYNPKEHTIDIWKAGKIIDKMPAETYAKQEGFKNFADLKQYVQNGEGLSLTPGFLTGKQKPYLYKISINTVGRYTPTVQEAIEADLRKKIANDLIVEKC